MNFFKNQFHCLRALISCFLFLLAACGSHAMTFPGFIDPPKPLLIAVDPTTPPFVTQGGNNTLYGYDISMMNYLCKEMNRKCIYQPLKWDAMLQAVMNNRVDMAISNITITPSRIKRMAFSVPYGLSYARLLANTKEKIPNPFSLKALSGKKLGVERGTVYQDHTPEMGITNVQLVVYHHAGELLTALANEDVDYILIDNPTALYWAANSSGELQVVGNPIVVGDGLGIVVSNLSIAILPQLNAAIMQYLNSQQYKINYDRFLSYF